MQDAAAFVLAGGRSSRMGRDKALVPVGERTFLQIALDNASAVCPKPIIVGPRSLYASYGEVIEDLVPGCGPLSGIHAALSVTTSDLNLVVSVDMPLMDSKFLPWLISTAATDKAVATVPRSGGRLQPLCAVYRRTILPEIEAALAHGRYKVDALFAKVPTRVIAEEECRSAGFHPDIFRNINTLEEYESMFRTPAESTPEAQRQ
jgi:molybdopterin-guanine dinucleotide biosynthesis protein A